MTGKPEGMDTPASPGAMLEFYRKSTEIPELVAAFKRMSPDDQRELLFHVVMAGNACMAALAAHTGLDLGFFPVESKQVRGQ